MILEVGDEAVLTRSKSVWSGAHVRITSIDDRRDEWGVMTIYSFEVLDKNLPAYDGDSTGYELHPYMGATPFKHDFLEV